jgi:hypothetical protein
MSSRVEYGKRWNRLVAMAWADEQLKSRLKADPAAVLREHGIEIPEGAELRVHENSSDVINLVIPTKPPREIADIQHEDSADASYFYTIF